MTNILLSPERVLRIVYIQLFIGNTLLYAFIKIS